jgi:hypothetical protein
MVQKYTTLSDYEWRHGDVDVLVKLGDDAKTDQGCEICVDMATISSLVPSFGNCTALDRLMESMPLQSEHERKENKEQEAMIHFSSTDRAAVEKVIPPFFAALKTQYPRCNEPDVLVHLYPRAKDYNRHNGHEDIIVTKNDAECHAYDDRYSDYVVDASQPTISFGSYPNSSWIRAIMKRYDNGSLPTKVVHIWGTSQAARMLVDKAINDFVCAKFTNQGMPTSMFHSITKLDEYKRHPDGEFDVLIFSTPEEAKLSWKYNAQLKVDATQVPVNVSGLADNVLFKEMMKFMLKPRPGFVTTGLGDKRWKSIAVTATNYATLRVVGAMLREFLSERYPGKTFPEVTTHKIDQWPGWDGSYRRVDVMLLSSTKEADDVKGYGDAVIDATKETIEWNPLLECEAFKAMLKEWNPEPPKAKRARSDGDGDKDDDGPTSKRRKIKALFEKACEEALQIAEAIEVKDDDDEEKSDDD